jgi:hypothetical protein
LLLGVLCLLTMPQSYNGGAPVSHPHALFQFWIPGGHLSAADHHGGSSMEPHEADGDHAHQTLSDHHPMSQAASANRTTVERSAQPDIPTISQVTPAAERGDTIGGILEPWFVLMLFALSGFFAVRTIRSGLAPLPELPPPRLTPAL